MKKRTDWFEEARYGMFVHWGAYSALGRGEWVLNRERISKEEYTRTAVEVFKAEQYDPASWAELARDAGMKYMVLTTRHLDGFALWETDQDDFHAGRLGPKQDLIRPYVEAVRSAGLRVGFYYSAANLNHPDYPGAFERDWPLGWHDENARKRFVKYYRAQLRELMTRYGKIDLLWFDGCIPTPIDGEETIAMVRELQPDILLNDRLGSPFDFACSEQIILAKDGLWEACMTLNDNWGFHVGDNSWKSPETVLKMLLSSAKDGGNLLLNVGPRADGTIPEVSADILREVGKWLRKNDEFLPRSVRSPFTWNNSSIVTVRGSSVYLHFIHSPGSVFRWAELRNRVLGATFVTTGMPAEFKQEGELLWLYGLPEETDCLAITIRLDVDCVPALVTEQKTFWIPG
ncbi:MAG: alpha-L-fucosidase [Lentisphaerae bacterium]|nr:alpha-L-fucosidase [Lentisphaerota bacterium]